MSSTDADAAPASGEVKLGVFWLARPGSSSSVSDSTASGSATASNPLIVAASPGKTVGNLKQELETRIPGGPLVAGQTIIWRGRRLFDADVLLDVVKEHGSQLFAVLSAFKRYRYRQQPPPETGYYTLHLSVNPSSWKTVDPASNTAARAAAERLAALSTGLAGPAAGGQNPTIPFNAAAAQAVPSTAYDLSVPSGLMPTLVPTPSSSMPVAAGTAAGSLDVSSLSAAVATLPTISVFEQWMPFYSYLAGLSTSQRGELIIKLAQADAHYAAMMHKAAERQRVTIEPLGLSEPQLPAAEARPDLEQAVENMLESLELGSVVKTATEQARESFKVMQQKQSDIMGGAQIGSSVVTIGGLPFLLQVPAGLCVPWEQRLEAYVDMQKYQSIRTLLATMLATTKASAAHVAATSIRARYGDAGAVDAQGHHPPAAVAGGAARPNGAGALGFGQQAAARAGVPTARLAIVINVEEILSLLIPLAFLAVKLGFLIYIFARHATPRKRYIMIAMAVFWIFWEGRAIRRRRRQQDARRAQNQQAQARQIIEQRVAQVRAQRDQLQQQAQQPAAATPAPNAGATQGAQHAHAQPVPVTGQQNNAGGAVNGHEQRGHNPYGQAAQGQPVAPGSPEEQALIAAGLQNGLERYQRERDRTRAAGRRARGEAGPAPAGVQANGRHAGHSRSHRHSDRPAPNRLSPKYWLAVVAKVGLSAEAREMGINRAALAANTTEFSVTRAEPGGPAAIPAGPDGQQPEQPAIRYRLEHRPPRFGVQRVLRIIFVCVVLFIGTLIPEVERMRRKYLERRQRRITELENARTAAALQRLRLNPPVEATAEEQQRRRQPEHIEPTRVPGSSSPQAQLNHTQSPGSRLRHSYIPEHDDTHIPAGADGTAVSSTAATAGGSSTQAAPIPASQTMLPTSSGESSSDHSHAGVIASRANARAAAAAAAQARQRAASGLAPPVNVAAGSNQLFDPPFSDAQYNAAMEQPPAGVPGSTSSAAGPSSTAQPIAEGSNSAPVTLNRDERMHLGVMDDPSVPTTPLLSPAEPDMDDDDALLDGEGDGEGENEGEGVDDEVGMILF